MSYRPKSGVLSGNETTAVARPPRPPRLLDQVRDRCRLKHYSLRTERVYLYWIKRFILANRKRHPRDMGVVEVEAFLSSLATRDDVAASTQNQALSALLFLYRQVLGIELPWMESVVRAKRPQKIPVVLSRDEVARLLALLDGQVWLMAGLLYGAGMRLMECVRLRVKDVDFGRNEICVRNGKGGKDRRVPLPRRLRERLREQVERVRVIHGQDLLLGLGEVHLPHALARKYVNAGREFGWQYVFPSPRHSLDPRTGRKRRHHVDEAVLQRAVKTARARAGIDKPATCHTFRHSFATHLLEDGPPLHLRECAPAHQTPRPNRMYARRVGCAHPPARVRPGLAWWDGPELGLSDGFRSRETGPSPAIRTAPWRHCQIRSLLPQSFVLAERIF